MSRAAELLQSHAEVMKLARLLDREPDQLAYLERLSPADLRALRDSVTETLYDAHGGALGRLAAASRLLPSGLTATIGQRAFGPLLSARLAGLLDTDKAVDVATKLPPPFLADVAVELDPRRASDLIASIAPGAHRAGHRRAGGATRVRDDGAVRGSPRRRGHRRRGGLDGRRGRPRRSRSCSRTSPTSAACSPSCPRGGRRASSRRPRMRDCGSRRSTCSTISTSASARRWCSPPWRWTSRRARRSSTPSSSTSCGTRSRLIAEHDDSIEERLGRRLGAPPAKRRS